MVLGCAAWLGPSFAAEAVARAVDLDDVDDLIDGWLDPLLADGIRGILLEQDPVDALPFVGGRYVHRYRFRRYRTWLTWRQFALPRSDWPRYLPALAKALDQATALDERVSGVLSTKGQL